MITNFFITGLLLIPWIFIPLPRMADAFRLPKATFFDLICMGMIVLSLFKGVNLRYINKYLAMFVGWVFITILFYWYVPYTNTINNTQQINFFIISPMIHFILGLWATYIALSVFEKEDFIKIAKALCLSSMIITAYGILQLIGLDPIKSFHYLYSQYMPNFTAILDHPSMVGNYLCLTLPFFLLFRGKKYIFGFMFVLLGLILTKSDLSIIVFVLSMILFSLITYRKNKRIIIGIILACLILSGIVAVKVDKVDIFNSLGGRVELWKVGYNHLKDNSLFGQGLGVYKTFNERADKDPLLDPKGKLVSNPHSDWLNLVIQIGFIGIFLFILVVVNAYRNFNYDVKNRLGIVYLVSFTSFLLLMTGSFPTEFAPSALLGLVGFWGLEKL